MDLLVHIGHGKNGKDHDRQKLLNDLEFRHGKDLIADSVGRYHETVFQPRDAPADQDHQEKRCRLEFQVPVPGKSH